MIETSKAIVLRQIKYSDSSRIVSLFTEKFGKQTFIMQGITSRKKQHFIKLLQPFYIVEITVNFKENANLQRFTNIDLIYFPSSFPFDIAKSSIVMFLSEFLTKIIHTGDKDVFLFNFLYNSIKFLDNNKENFADFHLIFLYKLTEFLGFCPVDNFSETKSFFDLQKAYFSEKIPAHRNFLNEKESFIWHKLLSAEYGKRYFSRKERLLLLEKIIEYYKIHLGNFGEIKSLEVLKQTFDF